MNCRIVLMQVQAVQQIFDSLLSLNRVAISYDTCAVGGIYLIIKLLITRDNYLYTIKVLRIVSQQFRKTMDEQN